MDPADFEALVKRLAYEHLGKLPSGSVYGVDDLTQEGWEAALDALITYDENKGTQLATWIWTCVRSRLKDIVRREWFGSNLFADDLEFEAGAYMVDYERLMTIAQIVELMAVYSEDFAAMVTEGVPEELFQLARSHERGKRFRALC